ncbi:PAS domain S-box-containing protein/diguanylate cyclase (GGDEF) domain-containing protein [Paenibacillus sp. UNCCL117]|uniref:diguanylate cyclase n=1 Tax=unclassified Paenibacillus TaxID=185978 RepID=UPI00088A926B|nr:MULTISPECIES: diguanylate cyclase [unclassified Paenibacillus]SDC64968.1 PAS domain S-box-containing protein/diguanylate cyclase (GGDEF) domain-containing protein [Paenibacillus sp. cl123]SFW22647.1 PAS domain S-box-containing protein/diguanylate cyclase (GGDEF) domain-containing protein [Paenibacillus sp. UNCCL117]
MLHGVIHDLMINFILIFTLVSLSVILLDLRKLSRSIGTKLGIGLLQGGFGIVLMLCSVHYDKIILDLRQLAIMSAAYFGGLPASLLAASLIAAFRIMYYGTTSPALAASASALVLGALAGIICMLLRSHWLKWCLMAAAGSLLLSLTLLTLLGGEQAFAVMPYMHAFLLLGSATIGGLIQLFHLLKTAYLLQRTVLNLSHQFMNSSITRIYELTLLALIRMIGAETGSILAIDRHRYRLVCLYKLKTYTSPMTLVGDKDVEAIEKTKGGQSLLYSNWKRERPMGLIERQLYKSGTRSSLHVPILYNGSVIALINLGASQSKFFRRKHLNMIHQIAPMISFAMALKDSESKFASVTQSAHDAIILTDQQLNITSWNQGATYIFGYSSEEMLGRPVNMIFPESYRERQVQEFTALSRTGSLEPIPSTIELKGLRKNGAEFPIELSLNSWSTGGLQSFSSIIRDISQHKEVEQRLLDANRKLTQLSMVDGLTGISNRRYFDEMFNREWKKACLNRTPIAIMLCDIDCFKGYNDTYGHQGGDRCLKEVAHTIQHALQRPNDFAARYGGEEFALILSGMDKEEAAAVAEAVRASVEALAIPHASSTAAACVTVSIGVYSFTPSPDMAELTALEQADKALYQAKKAGRNRIAVCAEPGLLPK